MGCLFIIILAGVSAAMIAIFGYSLWVMGILAALWLAALVFSFLFGHRGFGGGPNTDFMIMLAGVCIAVAIIIPEYHAQTPCAQAKIALKKVASAENEYFSKHKAYTLDLNLLDMKQNPEVYIMMLRADEKSFLAVATHASCEEENTGILRVFMWNSERGGII
jgi:hypothetical protein